MLQMAISNDNGKVIGINYKKAYVLMPLYSKWEIAKLDTDVNGQLKTIGSEDQLFIDWTRSYI